MADQEKASASSLPLRILGWVFGSLSVLNLIRDVTPLELYGLIRQWSDAYSLLVEKLGHFLFGWVQWGWVRIDPNESHVLVLAALIGTAGGRANFRMDVSKGIQASLWLCTLAGLVGIGGVVLLMMLFVPPPYSIWGGLVSLGLMFLMWFFSGEENFISARDFRKEVFVVAAGFAIIIVANYALFRP